MEMYMTNDDSSIYHLGMKESKLSNAKKFLFYDGMMIFHVFLFLGHPQPQYRWLKDGDYLSDFSSEHFYKIQSVKLSDGGKYQCIAKNSVGSILSEFIPLSVARKYFFKKNVSFFTSHKKAPDFQIKFLVHVWTDLIKLFLLHIKTLSFVLVYNYNIPFLLFTIFFFFFNR